MALIYDAQLTPGKRDLIVAWLPAQPWWQGDPTTVELVGAYRFDDPAGEVGLETHLIRSGDGPVCQVPLTYRGAPLVDGDLVATTEHSVLGTRWVYDAVTDPVYLATLTEVIVTGGSEAELLVETPDGFRPRQPTTRVRGSGATGRSGRPTVRRVLTGPLDVGDTPILTGVWPGQDEPVILAHLGRSPLDGDDLAGLT